MGNFELTTLILEEILDIQRKNNAMNHNYVAVLQAKGVAFFILLHYKEALAVFE